MPLAAVASRAVSHFGSHVRFWLDDVRPVFVARTTERRQTTHMCPPSCRKHQAAKKPSRLDRLVSLLLSLSFVVVAVVAVDVDVAVVVFVAVAFMFQMSSPLKQSVL